MKIALLSDIHGNGYALRAVIEAAKKCGVDHYLIAGDFIGYYYNISDILDMLDRVSYTAIRGNHEDMYQSQWIKDRDHLIERYGHGFDQCDRCDVKAFVDLPYQREIEIDNRSLLMFHGTPWDHDEYLYPDAAPEIIERVWSYQKDLVVFGHTHYQSIWTNNVGQILVNPGSVGQPRDYNPGACWALWDTTYHTVDLYREMYDTDQVIKECKAYDPHLPYLHEVLVRTRAE